MCLSFADRVGSCDYGYGCMRIKEGRHLCFGYHIIVFCACSICSRFDSTMSSQISPPFVVSLRNPTAKLAIVRNPSQRIEDPGL